MKSIKDLKRWMPVAHPKGLPDEIWANMVSGDEDFPPDDEGYVSWNELRESAIEDAKAKRRYWRAHSGRNATKAAGVVDYILNKFNLTEDDLKETDSK